MALKKEPAAYKGQQNLQAKRRLQSRLWKVVVFLTDDSHLGVDLHSGPVGLDQPPSARHIDGVPGVAPPVVVKLVARHVIPRLRNQVRLLYKQLRALCARIERQHLRIPTAHVEHSKQRIWVMD
jgi:hypothetical protein